MFSQCLGLTKSLFRLLDKNLTYHRHIAYMICILSGKYVSWFCALMWKWCLWCKCNSESISTSRAMFLSLPSEQWRSYDGGDRRPSPPNCVQDHSKSLNPCRSWGGGPSRMPSPLATCPPKQWLWLRHCQWGIHSGYTTKKQVSSRCYVAIHIGAHVFNFERLAAAWDEDEESLRYRLSAQFEDTETNTRLNPIRSRGVVRVARCRWFDTRRIGVSDEVSFFLRTPTRSCLKQVIRELYIDYDYGNGSTTTARICR